MMRMFTNVVFVLALASSGAAQNPFEGTEPDPVEVGQFLGIVYTSNRTESSVEVKIYDPMDELIDTITIPLIDGDGFQGWYVDEGITEFIILRDPWGGEIEIEIEEA